MLDTEKLWISTQELWVKTWLPYFMPNGCQMEYSEDKQGMAATDKYAYKG